ncbi:MAG: nitroreductase family protein [Planctomycetaceae bacterium]|nr:nitroreductase family protein [Planctomycetaceae bacterium]
MLPWIRYALIRHREIQLELLRELMRLQVECGFLSNEALRQLSRDRRVPLYRLEELVSFYPAFRRTPPPKAVVHVCRDVTCAMAGCPSQTAALKERLADRDDVEMHVVSCLGRCDAAPAASINEVPVAASSLEQLLAWIDGTQTLPDNSPTKEPRRWKCDPYKSADERYATVRSMGSEPDQIISRLSDSGLRGMGGAGFPTGRKWELVRNEQAGTKYVICNADESEPATFKDRVVLEELPHLVIEGMLLAGLTIGAETGIVYVRHEYERERHVLRAAIDDARQRGVLGEDAAGSGRNFDIEIFVSPGGYILGEETALLEALQDKRGEPRNKPPYPGQHGLWGKPTLINNVETFAFATSIVHHGVDWWREQGKDDFTGLKFVSVSGDVKNPGVYEIPIGTTVNELIEMASGVSDGESLQAFLPGGASSNFLPADKADTPLDFDAMKAAGSMLGTGAVIVIGQRHNLFDLATNIVWFFRNESCGKCVPCRFGSEKAVTILEGVQNGDSTSQLDILPELGATLEQTSICGLGQVALNPFLSLLSNIPDAVPKD